MEAKRPQELKSWILRIIFLAPNFLPQKISLSLPIKSSWKTLLPLPKSRHLLPAPKPPTVYNEHQEEKKQYQCKRFTLNNNAFWEEESMQRFTVQYTFQGRVWMQFLSLGDTSLIKQLLFTSTTMKTQNSSSICANVSLWTMQCFTLHINALREVVWMQFLVSSSSSCLPPPPLRSQIRVLSFQQVQTFISWMSSTKSFITIVVGKRGSVKSSQASLSLPKCFCSPHNLVIFPRRDRGNGNWCRKDLPGNANFAVAVKPYK